MVVWTVTIKTGDVRNAGTTANVFLTLIGKSGSSKEQQFKNLGRHFERNGTDDFPEVHLNDVGEVEQIKIRHDNSGENPDWFLDEVTLVNRSQNEVGYYKGQCHLWFSVEKSDHQIERTLPCVKL